MSVPDAIIAATAIRQRLTLVTLNHGDFERIPGLSLASIPETEQLRMSSRYSAARVPKLSCLLIRIAAIASPHTVQTTTAGRVPQVAASVSP